jgi:hypothetical protein
MALRYNGQPSPTSTAFPTTSKTVNGRGIKHRRLDRFQRAHWAADCVTGAVWLRPSIEQACLLFDVPRTLVRKHLKARNGNGARPQSNSHEETLAEHIARSSSTERLAAARIIGPAELWDSMISPVVEEDRASN